MDHTKRIIISTADGSPTVAIPGTDITYHSRHGAIQESMHIYLGYGLEAALQAFEGRALHIFEMGFGTGLNAYLTAKAAITGQKIIHYTSVEQYPLTAAEAASLNYAVTADEQVLFTALHACAWGEEQRIHDSFLLTKQHADLMDYVPAGRFHLIYYDAFAPGHQPGLWTKEIFDRLYRYLVPGGLLVTYCSKSIVRKAMQAAGFTVTKHPGPPGKREILSAIKA